MKDDIPEQCSSCGGCCGKGGCKMNFRHVEMITIKVPKKQTNEQLHETGRIVCDALFKEIDFVDKEQGHGLLIPILRYEAACNGWRDRKRGDE